MFLWGVRSFWLYTSVHQISRSGVHVRWQTNCPHLWHLLAEHYFSWYGMFLDQMGMCWRSKVVPFPNYRLHVSRVFFYPRYFGPIPCSMCHWICLDMLFASLDGSVSYLCIPCEFRIMVTRKIWTNTEWHRNVALILFTALTSPLLGPWYAYGLECICTQSLACSG